MRRAALLIAIAACSSPAPRAPTPPPDAAPAPPPPDAAPPPAADPPAPTFRLGDALRPTHVRARVRIDPDQPDFAGEIWIDATLATASKTVWLEAQGLTIDGAEVILAVDAKQPVRAEPSGKQFLALRADPPLAAGALTLHLSYHGTLETKTSAGAFVQDVAGARYVFSQFESTYARRVFPSVDEPWSKVPWQLTVEAPAREVVLSNTGVEREDKLDGGLVAHHFAETHPLPSYLVAFAIGPFDLVEAGVTRGGAPIRIAALAGRGKEAAWAAQITPGIVGALEDYFDLPFPYDKLDIVSIPQTYGFGAMENAGMITFVESGLLIEPGDPSMTRRRGCAVTLAHEIAHQWFGDLVTMPWWDDIWLNEGFATWVQGKVIATRFPDWNADLDALDQRQTALEADTLASARMIRQPVASQDDIESAFDRITYEKGASVLRMFERWVGPDVFQQGVRAYLKAHAYGNATATDFVAAISAAAGKNVSEPFATFLDQAGAPRVEASVRCDAGEAPTIVLDQGRYLPKGAPGEDRAGAARWKFPVCVTTDGGPLCALLDDAELSIALPTKKCPASFYANAGATGYYRVAMSADALAALVAHGWTKLSVAERLALATDVDAMVRRGDLDLGAALDLAAKLAAGSPREVGAAVELARLPARHVDDKQRKAYDAWLVRTFGAPARALGWTAKKGEHYDTERERLAVVALVADAGDASLRAQAASLAAKWRDLPAAMRGAVIAIAAADPRTFARLRAALPGEKDRTRRYELLSALGGVRDPARLAAALALVLDPALDARERSRLLYAVRLEPGPIAVQQAFLRDHLDELIAALPEQSRAGLANAVVDPCDAAQRDALAKRVTDALGTALAGPRSVAQAIERMDQCIAQRTMLAPAIAKRFGKP